MNIGKQSTLNDLGDLKKDLEAKIAAAAAIKVGEVSQIESGDVSSGSIYDERPTGVYHLRNLDDAPESVHPDNNAMMLHMDYANDASASAALIVGWGSVLTVVTRYSTTQKNVASVLTSLNTITDSNGFIKAA